MRFRFSSLVARAPLPAVFATLTQPGVPSVLFENIVLSHFQVLPTTGLAAEPKQHRRIDRFLRAHAGTSPGTLGHALS